VGGMRRSRYVGQAKTHLQNVAIATSLNVLRMVSWLMEVSLATTQKSRFLRLCELAGAAVVREFASKVIIGRTRFRSGDDTVGEFVSAFSTRDLCVFFEIEA
jgi:hypothetical protein